MGDKKSHDKVQELYNRLADSVLQLSDEAIIAEVAEAGVDPNEEAERVLSALKQTQKEFELAERSRTTEQPTLRTRVMSI